MGDSVYRLSGHGLWLTTLAAGLAALIVLALIPANSAGSSPGLRATGLRVISVNGTRARLHQHLIRTLVGVVDLLPLAPPGLVGWVAALRSPHRQRLGDRAARTVVVDLRHPERPTDPAPALRASHGRRRPVPVSGPQRPGPPSDAAIRWAIDELDAGLAPTFGPAAAPPLNPLPKRAAAGQLAANRQPAASGPKATTGPDPGRVPPQWSDRHQAWVVTDPQTGDRFRHDPETDRWLPLIQS